MRPPLFILAGGEGTRLMPLTQDTPKAMVEVFGKPFLYHLIASYRRQGFRDITIVVGRLDNKITDYPWPPGWGLSYLHDRELTSQGLDGLYVPEGEGHWVVNGDTWSFVHLPPTPKTYTILTSGGIDAGAHYVTHGKPEIRLGYSFIDIGTHEGLMEMRSYAEESWVEDDTVAK